MNDLNDIVPFYAKDIIVSEWVLLKCRYGCKLYNTNWCCPPATPKAEEVRRILNEYKDCLLIKGTQRCSELYLDNRTKRKNQIRHWKGIVSLERTLFLNGYYKAFSLVGAACGLCKKCSYPEPCIFPQEKRPTVESFSIDMLGTIKNIGITPKIANHRKEPFNFYSIILLR